MQRKVSLILESDNAGSKVTTSIESELDSSTTEARDEMQLLKCIQLCKSVVENNEGSMQVYVNEEGSGNTFQFSMKMDLDGADLHSMAVRERNCVKEHHS